MPSLAIETTLMSPAVGSGASSVGLFAPCTYNPSEVAHTILSFAQPTTVAAGVTTTSTVVPAAKVRISILPPRMYASRSPAGAITGDETPSGATILTSPPFAGTTSSTPWALTKYTVEESADHCRGELIPPPSGASCRSPVRSEVGLADTRGVGEGDGVGGAGGWVTNVIVCALGRC